MKRCEGKGLKDIQVTIMNEIMNRVHLRKENIFEPFTDLDNAILYIQNYQGEIANFSLPICNSMNDSMGSSTAVLLDEILKKGWLPNGFVQHDKYRTYLYKRAYIKRRA